MGYKSVCSNCRKAFSRGTDYTKFKYDKVCPECGKTMGFFYEKFRPPKKTDSKKWEIINLLVECSIEYRICIGSFPETMEDAVEFVRYAKNPPLATLY